MWPILSFLCPQYLIPAEPAKPSSTSKLIFQQYPVSYIHSGYVWWGASCIHCKFVLLFQHSLLSPQPANLTINFFGQHLPCHFHFDVEILLYCMWHVRVYDMMIPFPSRIIIKRIFMYVIHFVLFVYKQGIRIYIEDWMLE